MNSNLWVNILLAGAVLMLVAQVARIPLLFAVSFPLVMVTWMILGAMKNNKIGRGLKFSLVSLFVIWVVGFLALNLMDHSKFTGTILGFMPGTAIMIYVIWLLPLFVGTLVYSMRFDRDYLQEEDIKRLESKNTQLAE